MENIQEVLQAAENGNVTAMLMLSNYYYSSEDKDVEKSQMWADRAADAGSVDGYRLSMVLHAFGARVAEQLGFQQLVQEEWQKTLDRAQVLKGALHDGVIDLPAEERANVDQKIDDARYGIARSRYFEGDQDNCDAIIPLIMDVKTTRARALYGICCFHVQDYAMAYRQLTYVLNDAEYAAAEKDVGDEAIYAEGMQYLSGICRIGLPGIVDGNSGTAVNVLNQALQYVRDEDFRKHLLEELNRYQKKLFGGYRYV